MIVPTGKQPEPGPLARAFSAHVRMVMARDRVTAQALAEAAGISRSYLGKRLRDEAPFSLNDVESISKALGIELPKL
jgi:DNA-binding phage protein